MYRSFSSNRQTRSYFIPALLLKYLGAISIGLIYQFYYGWGDTFTYFREARIIWSIFLDEPISALRIIFQPAHAVNDLFHLTNRIWTFRSTNNFTLVRILSFFNLFTFNTYSATALIFATFSFGGSWAFYSALAKKYPWCAKHLAFAILFMPSVIIWGSGIFKDTISFAALMYLSWGLFHLIENGKIKVHYIFVCVIAVVVIASIKVYILICYLPVAILWISMKFIKSIQHMILRLITVPFIVIVSVLGAYFSALNAGEVDRRYALENIAQTARITAYDIRYYSGKEGGSGYALGELDGSWERMLLLSPLAINVSLFRPYLWEIGNPLMLLSALESSVFLISTVWLIFFRKNLISKVIQDPFLTACFGFSILFAFAVGISTFNFGTLVRYKIPLLPFYTIGLALLIKRHPEKS